MIYDIPPEESYLTLIEPNIRETNLDVKIQFLVKDSKEKIKLRTISYSRPFEKKEGICDLENCLEEKDQKFPANTNLIRVLADVQEVHLVERKDEYGHSKFGLIILHPRSVFFFDMERSKDCAKLFGDDC